MLKKRLFGIFVIFCFISAADPVDADGLDYQGLMDYLNQSFPDQYRVLATISLKNDNRFMFSQNESSLAKGQELLVLENQSGIPVSLLSPIGVLQIESLTNDAYIARQIAAWSENEPDTGDPVVIPVSPTIYLSADTKTGRSAAPYQKLLQALIRENYEVKELDSTDSDPGMDGDKYGVLVRLEGAGSSLTLKIQSLYSGATLYSEIRPGATDSRIRPPGLSEVQTDVPQTRESKNFQTVDPAPNRQIMRLSENFHRLVICQLDDTKNPEFALLNNDKVQVFHSDTDTLEPVYAYEFETRGLVGLHLHAMDLTGDGLDELIVTMGRQETEFDAKTTKLQSLVLGFTENRLERMAGKLPWYLRVIPDSNGKPVLLGQKKGEYQAYSGEIFEIRLNASRDVSAERYPPASGIYSVNQFSFLPEFPDHIMILEASGLVTVYQGSTRKIAAISDTGLGRFNIVSYPVKLEELEFSGGFDNKITFTEQPAPRRFLLKQNYDSQVFTINKQRETDWGINRLKNMISDQKSRDSLVAFKWTGQDIRQTWESEKLSKDILDFSFMPGKNQDVIFVLVRDAQGTAVQTIE